MTAYRMVNGELVELTDEELAEIEAVGKDMPKAPFPEPPPPAPSNGGSN